MEETESYIRNRTSLAGAGDGAIFDPAAIRAIHRCSQGIPRLINLVGERSLRDACALRLIPVPEHLVQRVASEFQLDDAKLTGMVLHPFRERPTKTAAFSTEAVGSRAAGLGEPLLSDVESLLSDVRGVRKSRGREKEPQDDLSSVPRVSLRPSPSPPAAQPMSQQVTSAPARPRKREHVFQMVRTFLTNPMPRFRYGIELQRQYDRLCGSMQATLTRSNTGLAEVVLEANSHLRYLPEASAEFAAELFRCLEYVPDWILSSRWKQRCADVWKKHRQTYDSLMRWLRGPLPF